MNIRKIIFTLCAVIFIIAIIILFFYFSLKNSPLPSTTLPTATPFTRSTLVTPGPLSLVSSVPKNDSYNTALDAKILLTFNNPLTQNNLGVSITPSVPLSFEVKGNILSINLLQNLSPQTNYILTTTIGSQTFFVRFSTASEPTISPDTRDNSLINEQQEELKKNYPDIYLSNFTPYNSNEFSITSSFVSSPEAHYQFTVASNLPNKKEFFEKWALEKGLNSLQISSLDVVYK